MEWNWQGRKNQEIVSGELLSGFENGISKVRFIILVQNNVALLLLLFRSVLVVDLKIAGGSCPLIRNEGTHSLARPLPPCVCAYGKEY